MAPPFLFSPLASRFSSRNNTNSHINLFVDAANFNSDFTHDFCLLYIHTFELYRQKSISLASSPICWRQIHHNQVRTCLRMAMWICVCCCCCCCCIMMHVCKVSCLVLEWRRVTLVHFVREWTNNRSIWLKIQIQNYKSCCCCCYLYFVLAITNAIEEIVVVVILFAINPSSGESSWKWPSWCKLARCELDTK